MKSISQIIKSNQSLVKNFTSLSLLQISNYIFPLITLPYLVRVLGPEKYGLINFAAAFTAYFTILTDYGFNLSAVQEVSVNRNNTAKLSEIFSSVLFTKITLFVFSSILFFLIINSFTIFKDNFILYLVTYFSVLGAIIYPVWFYQGIESMKHILVITIVVRSVTTLIIFIIIKTENDFVTLAAINSLNQCLIGIIALWISMKNFEIKIKKTNLSEIKRLLKSGLNIFLSTIWINIYTASNIFILGLFAPAKIVGYFAAADKVRLAFQGIITPVSQSVFPYVNKLLVESYEKFINFNKKLFKIALLTGAVISITLFVFAEQIVNYVLGHNYEQSILVLKIIAWLPMIIILSNVLGIQTMIPLNRDKSFSLILLFAALINVIISFLMVPDYLEIGTSISLIITETFVTVSFFIFLKLNKVRVL